MTQRNIPDRARRNRPGWRRARIPVALAAGLLLCAAPGAEAQIDRQSGPQPPPASAPQSRLTVTRAEFERWMAGNIPDSGDIATTEPRGPLLVAPPPPAPVLVAPPPAPPNLAPIRGLAPTPELATPPGAPVTTPDAPKLTPTAPPETPTPPATPVAVPEQSTPNPVAPARPPATVQTPLPAAPDTTPATPTRDATPPVVTAQPDPPPPPPEQQVATLPPDSRDTPAITEPRAALPELGTIRIPFAVEETKLSEGARERLNEVATRLKARPGVRLQIVGYASEIVEATGQARRRSLYRVISVREYLVGQGVLSTRMDVRALGDKTEVQPRDRVDVIIPPS